MNVTALAWRNLSREWRAGELTTLMIALIVGVAAMTGVRAFTDRVSLAMQASANELLAADLVLRSRTPIDEQLAQEAAARGLESTRVTGFPSVAFHDDASQLADVKAVGPGYPLRGAVQVADRPFAAGSPTDSPPKSGEAWADSRLATALELEVGDTVEVGELTLSITAIVTLEPDRGGDLFSVAPRLMIAHEDLAASGLLGPGSRASYRLLLAGTPAQITDYRDWFEAAEITGIRTLGIDETQQQLRAALDRAERFLGLAALSAILLAGVAIVIAAQRFAQRHYDAVAIMRCVGAPQNSVLAVFIMQILLAGLPAAAIGAGAGYALQGVLTATLGSLVPGDLPLPGIKPALWGVATGIVILIGFALPPLARLRRVTPMRVLHRQNAPVAAADGWTYGVPLLAAVLLVLWQTYDLRLAAFLLAGAGAAIGALVGAAWLLIRILRALTSNAGGAWRFGLASVARRSGASAVQIAGLGLGLTVILLLGLVRGELLDQWRTSLPDDAPNHFLINVRESQVEETERTLEQLGVDKPVLYPMATGKLASMSGANAATPEFERRRDGTINLSWSDELPDANEIVAGQWFDESDRAEISLEDRWAEALGIAVGDEVTFDIGGQLLTGEVTSFRKVEWDSFEVNFFILVKPSIVNGVAHQNIASFYLSKDRAPELIDLVRRFPNLSVLDVEDLMQKVREVIDRVTTAVEFVFLFTLAAGLTVLFAALQITQSDRIYEGALLRTLGAGRKRLTAGVLAEFSVLGGVAGLLSGVAATGIGLLLARQVFNIPFQPGPLTLVIALTAGLVGALIVGVVGNRRVVRTLPVRILRDS